MPSDIVFTRSCVGKLVIVDFTVGYRGTPRPWMAVDRPGRRGGFWVLFHRWERWTSNVPCLACDREVAYTTSTIDIS